MAEKLFFGIDGGGTYSRIALINEKNEIISSAEAGSTNIYSVSIEEACGNIAILLDSALQNAGLVINDIASGCMGSAGLGREDDLAVYRGFFVKLFGGKFPVKLCSDAEILLCGGLRETEGYCLIAGTGSIAMGRSKTGEIVRAGGHGYLLGDEGGAAWTGRIAVSRILRSLENRDLKTGMLDAILKRAGLGSSDELVKYINITADKAKTAALAPVVSEAAESGDELALDIINKGADELALLVKSVRERSLQIRNQKIILAGGAIENDHLLRENVTKAIKKYCPDMEITLPQGTALEGACLLALNQR